MEDHDWLMNTERLRFGVWRDDDGPLAAKIWGDADVTALTGGPFSAEQVARRLALEIGNWRRFSIQYWPVFLRNGGSLAGCCGLRPRDMAARTAELGFQLCRDAWGQGIAVEAARAVIERAHRQGFTALIAGHHPDNHASKRALLKLGFCYTHDELYPPTGGLEPCYLLEIGEGEGALTGTPPTA